MTHPKSQLLSDYLDGELSPPQAQDLEQHLRGCVACSALYRELEEVRSLAKGMSDQYPAKDLWPDIARAIQPDGRDSQVIELHPGIGAARRDSAQRGAFRLSYVQAAAAGLILALFSGAMGSFLTESSAPRAAVAPSGKIGWVEMVGNAHPELGSSAQEVANLEETLAEHRHDMDPSTALVIERNLELIDHAIRESLLALEADPENEFLEGHLARAVASKATFLREATSLVAPVS